MTTRNPNSPDEIILDADDLLAWDEHVKGGKRR
jgi:hypothetical protein